MYGYRRGNKYSKGGLIQTALDLSRAAGPFVSVLRPRPKRPSQKYPKKRKTPTTPSFKLRTPAQLLQMKRRRTSQLSYKNYSGCRVKQIKYPYRGQRFNPYSSSFRYCTKSVMKKVNVWNNSNLINVAQIGADINKCAYHFFYVGLPADFDAICKYKYRNDTTVVTAEMEDQNNTKMASKEWMNIKAKNNTGLDVKAEIYYFEYKDNVNGGADAYISTGLTDYTDATVTTPETNLLLRPEQATGFNRVLKVLKKEYVCIEPGKEICVKLATRWFEFDPQIHDRAGTTYAAGITRGIMFRLQGQICHDSASTAQVGISAPTLDVVYTKVKRYGFITDNEIKQYAASSTFGTLVTPVGANDEGAGLGDNPVN